MTNKKKNMVGRRSFIRGASAAALGSVAIGASAALTVAGSANSGKTHGFDYDVIVIGGGFAGITASRDLMQQGLDTVVFEARNRLGGRTFTADFGGHKVELGGTWIHWFQPHVWAEVNKYGLELSEMIPPQEEAASVLVDGKPQVSPLLEKAELIMALFDKIFPDARLIWERPYDQSYRWDHLIQREPLTMRQRLDELDITSEEIAIAESVISTMAHATLDDASYVEMARWYAAAGWNFFDLLDTTGRYMFKDGTISLINAMVADGGQEVRLSTVVEKVEQKTDHVIVTTEDGQTITARALVNTIPMNVLADVEFKPALSSLKMQASAERHCAAGVKVYAEVKGHHNKILGLGRDTEEVSMWLTYKELENSTLFMGFGPKADALDPNDTEAVQASLRKHLPKADVIASTGYQWTLDPFSKGTYCSYRPGQLKRFGKEMTRHEGRILMGSGDHGEGWRGFIDGAIARGSKVAQDTAKLLRDEV